MAGGRSTQFRNSLDVTQIATRNPGSSRRTPEKAGRPSPAHAYTPRSCTAPSAPSSQHRARTPAIRRTTSSSWQQLDLVVAGQPSYDEDIGAARPSGETQAMIRASTGYELGITGVRIGLAPTRSTTQRRSLARAQLRPNSPAASLQAGRHPSPSPPQRIPNLSPIGAPQPLSRPSRQSPPSHRRPSSSIADRRCKNARPRQPRLERVHPSS